jgi:Ca2+:H+ antiporter
MAMPSGIGRWILLSFVPIAIALKVLGAGPVPVFVAAGLAILPLAGLMGQATEHLAARVGTGLGAFLNASFGNAAELILAFVALRKGLTEVVKASITGSIIGNSLLVLGAGILAGGVRHRRQTFQATAAGVGSTLLALSAAALILPATFHHIVPGLPLSEERMSLAIAVILFLAYLASLAFSFRTHRHLYDVGAEHEGLEPWGRRRAFGLLLLATVLIAVMSEILVGEVEEIGHAFGLNEVFIGVIVLALLGNAAEHSTAVIMAYRNRMDLALGITIGSSTQVALFVAPLLVFVSFAMEKHLDLVFTLPEVVAVSASAWIVSLVAHDGECHWLEGALLLALYAILGITFYFLPGV